MESIAELKTICQKKKTQYHTSPWASRHLHRAVSIYLTKILLMLGVSANQATLLSILFGITGSSLLISTRPVLWIIAAFILYIHVLLDHSDGEIARYRKSSSPSGRYYDEIGGMIIRPYFYSCISIGTYRFFHYDKVLIIALIVVIFSTVFYLSNGLPNQILYESKDIVVDNPGESHGKPVLALLMETGKNFLGLGALGFLWVALAAVIDHFVPPWKINVPSQGAVMFNARAVLFYLMSLGLFVNGFTGIILKGRTVARTFHKIKAA
jgi:phosphatidylglycerophosphate synthase